MESEVYLSNNRAVVAARIPCRNSELCVLIYFKIFLCMSLRIGGRCDLCVVANAGLTKEKIPRGHVK